MLPTVYSGLCHAILLQVEERANITQKCKYNVKYESSLVQFFAQFISQRVHVDNEYTDYVSQYVRKHTWNAFTLHICFRDYKTFKKHYEFGEFSCSTLVGDYFLAIINV